MSGKRFLNSSIMINSNWIVFTGPASSGKSTMVAHFRKMGWTVKQEMVRAYLKKLFGEKVPVEQIPWSNKEFQKGLLLEAINREAQLDPSDHIIFDRGVPDIYVYAALRGIDLTPIFSGHQYRYKYVFLFDTLPVVQDELRRDTDEEAKLQYKKLAQVYRSLSYELIQVGTISSDKHKSITGRKIFLEKAIISSTL